jgi:lactoylglutathione lyase
VVTANKERQQRRDGWPSIYKPFRIGRQRAGEPVFSNPALAKRRAWVYSASAMIKKLLHTRYRVEDLEKTVAFYRDVLGLEEVRRVTSGRGSQLVFFKAPQSEELIEICKFDGSGPVRVGPDLTHLAFEVDDLAAFAARAEKLGYPLSDGPHQSSGGSVIAFVDAPEGYEIELIQPVR